MAGHTWVCCRHDGPKEETVSEVKISTKLTHSFHEPHKAVHDQSTEITDVHESSQNKRPHQFKALSVWNLPNNEAGSQRSHEGIGQDGADVSEKMSLADRGRRY